MRVTLTRARQLLRLLMAAPGRCRCEDEQFTISRGFIALKCTRHEVVTAISLGEGISD